jgi:hypothetical protein
MNQEQISPFLGQLLEREFVITPGAAERHDGRSHPLSDAVSRGFSVYAANIKRNNDPKRRD